MCLYFLQADRDKWDAERKKRQRCEGGRTDIHLPLNGLFILSLYSLRGSTVIQQLQQSFSALLFLHGSQFTLYPRLNQKSVQRLRLVASPAAEILTSSGIFFTPNWFNLEFSKILFITLKAAIHNVS